MKIDSSVNVQSAKKSAEYTVNANSVEVKRSNNIDGDNEKFEFEVSEALLDKSIEKANNELVKSSRRIERSVHEKTKAIMYKVVDVETDEVIKEFPPEKIQDMIAKMWELAGLFVDEQA